MSHRYEVTPSGGCWAVGSPDRWCVRPEGCCMNVAKHVPYTVASALARHLNAQDPEPGDVAALVGFILDKGRA